MYTKTFLQLSMESEKGPTRRLQDNFAGPSLIRIFLQFLTQVAMSKKVSGGYVRSNRVHGRTCSSGLDPCVLGRPFSDPPLKVANSRWGKQQFPPNNSKRSKKLRNRMAGSHQVLGETATKEKNLCLRTARIEESTWRATKQNSLPGTCHPWLPACAWPHKVAGKKRRHSKG